MRSLGMAVATALVITTISSTSVMRVQALFDQVIGEAFDDQ